VKLQLRESFFHPFPLKHAIITAAFSTHPHSVASESMSNNTHLFSEIVRKGVTVYHVHSNPLSKYGVYGYLFNALTLSVHIRRFLSENAV
jgi:hypothetical protein